MDCRLFTYIKVGDLVGKTAVFGKEAVLRKINITKKFEKNKKKAPKSEDLSAFSGAAGRIRTADLILTKWLKAPKVLLSSAFGAFLFPRRVVFGAFRSIVSIRSFPRVGHGVGQVAFSNNTMPLRRS